MKLLYTVGDLLRSTDSLAHCVSLDFHMSAGIANSFRLQFSHQQVLRAGPWRVGTAARVREGDRYIFYLVTKFNFYDLPELSDIRSSLRELAKWIELLNISSLAIPRLACGRDRHQWSVIEQEIISVFSDVPVIITVYDLS